MPNPSKQNLFLTTSQVVFGILKYLSVRRPRLFYGVPAMAALTIALGFWIRSATLLSATGRIEGDIALIALGATIIGLILLTIAIIMNRLVITVRRTSSIMSVNHLLKAEIVPEVTRRKGRRPVRSTK